MTADDLLEIARELSVRDPARPKQSSLKRATSTAYYALFHALAYECVAQIVGWSVRSDRYWELVSSAYRVIDHAPAKRLFNRFTSDSRVAADLREIALAFVALQEARIQADYDPTPSFTRGDTVQSVRRAERAVRLLRSLPADTKRDLVVQIVGKQR